MFLICLCLQGDAQCTPCSKPLCGPKCRWQSRHPKVILTQTELDLGSCTGSILGPNKFGRAIGQQRLYLDDEPALGRSACRSMAPDMAPMIMFSLPKPKRGARLQSSSKVSRKWATRQASEYLSTPVCWFGGSVALRRALHKHASLVSEGSASKNIFQAMDRASVSLCQVNVASQRTSESGRRVSHDHRFGSK